VSYLFALFPIGIGFLLWGLGVKGAVAARKQSGWATTQGLIRSSSIKTSDVNVPFLGATKVRSTGWSGTGAPKVTYEYDVGDRTYTGTKVGMPPQRRRWGGHNSSRGIDWNLALYEQGASIPVHYDPANPVRRHPAQGGGQRLRDDHAVHRRQHLHRHRAARVDGDPLAPVGRACVTPFSRTAPFR
jgi:hypothetical protein